MCTWPVIKLLITDTGMTVLLCTANLISRSSDHMGQIHILSTCMDFCPVLIQLLQPIAIDQPGSVRVARPRNLLALGGKSACKQCRRTHEAMHKVTMCVAAESDLVLCNRCAAFIALATAQASDGCGKRVHEGGRAPCHPGRLGSRALWVCGQHPPGTLQQKGLPGRRQRLRLSSACWVEVHS
jgi:hypothetical protein